jgi:hypothetical protein
MALNDFETVPSVDSDDQIISKIGGAVRAALSAKESLSYAMTEALDSSTTFGYELGAEDMKVKIITAFEASDSAHSDWALGVIKTALN